MTDKDFELLSQYLDGELDELSTRRVEQRLEAEPALRATFGEMLSLDRQIQLALGSKDKVPAHIANLLRSAAPSKRPVSRRPLPYAIAASVAAIAGLLLTLQLQDSSESGPTLAEVLEITPSMASGWQPLGDGKLVRPILTFRDVDGAWCREFLLDNHGQGSRGVACRDQGEWETRLAVSAEIPGGSEMYRPAASADVDAIADYTARRAEGVALSSSEESGLIATDWQAD